MTAVDSLVSYYIGLILSVSRALRYITARAHTRDYPQGIGITSPAIKTSINGGLQVFNLIMALGQIFVISWLYAVLTDSIFPGAALVIEKFGRRRLFLISNTGMFFSFALWTIFTALFTEMGYQWAGKGWRWLLVCAHTIRLLIFRASPLL